METYRTPEEPAARDLKEAATVLALCRSTDEDVPRGRSTGCPLPPGWVSFSNGHAREPGGAAVRDLQEDYNSDGWSICSHQGWVTYLDPAKADMVRAPSSNKKIRW